MTTKNAHIHSILQRLPHNPGVYQYLNKEGEIIYVGKAKDLNRRVHSYFNKDYQSSKTRQLVSHIADIKYIVVDNEQDAFLLENNLIKQLQPRYNILLKDGKSYPSICITKEPYPRIIKTRTIIKGNGEYFGPFSYGHTVDLVIELIHKLFPLRTCRMPITNSTIAKNKVRVCLKYHLNNCCGICENKPGSEQYNDWVAQARKIIKGDAQDISTQLEKQMLQYAHELKFEQAAEIKRKIELLEQFKSKTIVSNTHTGDIDVFGYDEQEDRIYISILHVHNGSITQGNTIEYKRKLDETKQELLAFGIIELREQLNSSTKDIIVPFIPDIFDASLHIFIATNGEKKKLLDLAMQNVRQYKVDRIKQEEKLNPDYRANRILGELQQIMGLPTLPRWIDCFDNSNTQGTNAVAGCVVYKMARACKTEYKRFTIKTANGQDDYASMREIVRRRYQHLLDDQSDMPDLIIADGGLGQMNAIREAIEDQLGLSIPIAGLKKNNKHRTQTLLYGFPPAEISMPVTSEVFRLLTNIQDEVHRFAISYHKKKRSKAQTHSQLDDIQGVGSVTKQKILQHFGSVKRAKSAEKSEWIKLLGTSRGSAIYEQIMAKTSL